MRSICSRAALLSVALGMLIVARATYADEPSHPSEEELIALLQSEAPPADKAMACKQLAVHGSEAAAPELAKLLSDERLASWARIALEAIPGPAVDEALRTAAGSLEGRLLVGVVNSIGVRRDAEAVELLAGLLNSEDGLVASSAAVALGRVGNAEATAALRGALAGSPDEVRSAAAEGLVLCAERALAEKRTAEAIEIYDEVRAAEVPKQRVIEATRGAILARGDDGIPLLLEQLQSGDKAFFYIALSAARELPGTRIDAVLAEQLPAIAPFRAPALIATMADRPETVIVPAIQEAAASGPEAVRLAAIAALGRVGDVSCFEGLLRIVAESDAELAATAKQAIAALPDDRVDQLIVERLEGATGATYVALLELIGERNIDALQPLIEALDHSDHAARVAALGALGRTIPMDRLSILIEQVRTPKHPDDAAAAQQALKKAAVRMPDREACAEQLAAALEGAPVASQVALLEVIAAVGGMTAVETLHAAARTGDPQLRDASTRLLGEWLTVDAAPVLLDIAKSAPADRFQVRALRGYIRIIRQFVSDDAERIAMCRQALEAAAQPAEKKLVLEVLERSPSVGALTLAIELLEQPEVTDDAARSTLAIARKITGQNDEVVRLLGQAKLPKLEIEILKAEYGSDGARQDVTEILKQHVTDRPIIVLPAASYNEAFGGDPAPGEPKQLRVQYSINGKAGEATFAEDRLIILSLLK